VVATEEYRRWFCARYGASRDDLLGRRPVSSHQADPHCLARASGASSCGSRLGRFKPQAP
jgi:hypothetical protein